MIQHSLQYLLAQTGKDYSVFFFLNVEPRVCRARYRAEMLLSWPVIAFGSVTSHVNMAGPFSSMASSLVMPSKENPQALMQNQKWCPAVSTTPTRLHWVTIKPYSKDYLSSLKGSALTLGVSIDLGNTVPSAPEITKQNRRQIVNIINCYQGSDCQIIPRCNLTHCLTPCLSCTLLLSPEKPDLVHLQWVALITHGICP